MLVLGSGGGNRGGRASFGLFRLEEGGLGLGLKKYDSEYPGYNRVLSEVQYSEPSLTGYPAQ